MWEFGYPLKIYRVFGKLAYWTILAYFDINRGFGGQTG